MENSRAYLYEITMILHTFKRATKTNRLDHIRESITLFPTCVVR